MADDNYDIISGEEKSLSYTFDPVVDVSSATLTATFEDDRDNVDTTITIADGDFDKSSGASGIVTFTLDDTDTAVANIGTYLGEIKAVVSASSTVKGFVTLRIAEGLA